MANNPKHKDNLKNFPKGQSGNPAGRPKQLPDLKEIIQNNVDVEAIIQKLNVLAKKGNIKAAQELLDRGYGKVAQKTEITGKDGEAIKTTMKVIFKNMATKDESAGG